MARKTLGEMVDIVSLTPSNLHVHTYSLDADWMQLGRRLGVAWRQIGCSLDTDLVHLGCSLGAAWMQHVYTYIHVQLKHA